MISGIFIKKLILTIHFIPNRQWSEFEILALSMTVLLLLVWLTKIQRNKKVRRNYHNQFLENTPAMGMRWGVHHKNLHIGNDSEKDQLATVQKQQNMETNEPEEKPQKKFRFQSHTNIYKQNSINSKYQISRLMSDIQEMQCERTKSTNNDSDIDEMKAEHKQLQEEIKKLQSEIVAHNQAREIFEQQVYKLKADNEKWKDTIVKYEQTELQNKKLLIKLEKLQEENKQFQNEISTHKQTKENFKQQVSELMVDNEKLKDVFEKYELAQSQNNKNFETIEKLQEEIEQLQNEIITYKHVKESFEQQVSELTADNEKLHFELTELVKAESKIAEMTIKLKQIQKENFLTEQISEPQIVTESAIEKPVSGKTAINIKQHRIVNGVRQKLCKKCNEWKPENEFHKNASSKDNLAADCKVCKNNAAKERRNKSKQLKNDFNITRNPHSSIQDEI